MSRRSDQKGAALLVVLLLAATLSFIALGTMERTSSAALRAANAGLRREALWRALAVEILSVEAVNAAVKQGGGRMSLDDPWAAAPLELPFDGGAASIRFRDATSCFNLNSLGADSGDSAALEFVRLAEIAGVGAFDAVALAEAIADWIDADVDRRPQGAEDETYSTLPSPYRTANQLMATPSELRAVRGVTREIYTRLRPYLCAQPSADPSPINVNMLTPAQAPVLAAALGDGVSVQTAADVIAARPPGGHASVEIFLDAPQLQGLQQAEGRLAITSAFVEARADIVYETALLEMTSEIAVQGGAARVISRRIGAEE